MKLIELAQGWDEFSAAMDAADGELSPEMSATLDCLNLSERAKVDGYVFALKLYEGDCLSYRSIEDELAAKRRTAERRIAWLKQRVREYMAERDVSVLEGEIYKFRKVVSGKAPVEVLVEPKLLPAVYTVTTITADKEKLRTDIVAGTLAPGLARLGEPSVSLRIY